VRTNSLWLSLLLVLVLTVSARAHGGGGYRGPPGDVPPRLREPSTPALPTIPCDCAQGGCRHCNDRTFTPEQPQLETTVAEQVLSRWDDFARVRFTFTFRGTAAGPIEAHTPLAPGALFAATAGRIEQGGATLVASLAPAREARRKYLYAKENGLDPFLLLPLSPGRYALRAFPVRDDGETRVVLEGTLLSPARRKGSPRLYSDGLRVLVVEEFAGKPPGGDLFADRSSGRLLRFFSLEEARRRYGPGVDKATELPPLAALETAATGRGDAAAGAEVVLLAVDNAAVTPEVVPARRTEQGEGPAVPPPPESASLLQEGE